LRNEVIDCLADMKPSSGLVIHWVPRPIRPRTSEARSTSQGFMPRWRSQPGSPVEPLAMPVSPFSSRRTRSPWLSRIWISTTPEVLSTSHPRFWKIHREARFTP
jgi:hypothetical protein